MAPVDRAGAYADGRVEPVAANLDGPVEQFLDRPGGTLHPGLPGIGAEELGRLDDGDIGVIEVRQGLDQEVRARREVGVEYDEELAATMGKGVSQVARFLVLAPVRPDDVPEPEAGRDAVAFRVGRIVK